MGNDIVIEKIEEFVEIVKGKNISKLAFAEVNEHRPYQVKEKELEMQKLKKVDVLAYKDSIIYKCVVVDQDLDGLYNDLLSKGFDVKRQNRNLI